MKKLLKIVGGIFLVLIVLGIIGAAAGGGKGTSSGSATSNQQSTQAQAQPEAPKVATKVEAQTIVGDFDKNKLSATDKYKGNLYEFTAKVKNISEDITGSPFLSLEPVGVDQYYFGTTLQCFFKDTSPLKSLANGQSVTLRGTNDGMSIGIVLFKDCEIIK